MKKTKLIATIMTICLAVCTLAYGVYAATNLSFTIGANIAFEVQNLFVNIDGTISGVYDNLGDERIIADYNYDAVPTDVSIEPHEWTLGSIYFNPDAIEPIIITLTITNLTPGKMIECNLNTPLGELQEFVDTNVINGSPDILTATANPSGEAGNSCILRFSFKQKDLVHTFTNKSISFGVQIDVYNPILVSLNTNGLDNLEPIEYEGEAITPPTMTNKTLNGIDYEFMGWYEDDEYTQELNWATFVPTENTTVYARYESNYVPSLKVTFPSQTVSYMTYGANSDINIYPWYTTESGVDYLLEWFETPGCSGDPVQYDVNLGVGETKTLYGKKCYQLVELSNCFTFNIRNNTCQVYGSDDGTQAVSLSAFSIPPFVTYNTKLYKLVDFGGNIDPDAPLEGLLIPTTVTQVHLPNTITTLSSYAFAMRDKIISINIPSSVTTISNDAFEEMKRLVQVRNRSNVNLEISGIDLEIVTGDEPFTGTIELINNVFLYTKNDNVWCMGSEAVTTISLPLTCNGIYQYAFKDSIITTITIPNSVTTIGEYAFYHCNLESISMSDSLTTIGNNAFSSCSHLNSIDLSDCTDLVTIGEYVFNSCSNLTSILLPNSNSSLISIGQHAFSDCRSLTSINLPDSIRSLGGYDVFSYCTNLTEVIINSPLLTTYGNDAFYYCNSNLKIYILASGLNTYMTATNWVKYATKMVGFADLISGQALPTIAKGTYTTATWYSDKACTTVVTGNASATQRYYVKLS